MRNQCSRAFVIVATAIVVFTSSVAHAAQEVDPGPAELIYSGVKGTVSDPQTATITNVGDAPLEITGIALGGTSPGEYTIDSVPATPVTIAPAGNITVDVTFTPGGSSVGVFDALLVIDSDDATDPSVSVALWGLSANGLEGGNEPPLHLVVTTLGHDIDVGGTQLSLGTNPNPIGDEVLMPLMRKAGPGVVTMRPVARYSPDFFVDFGWYEPNGAAPILNEVGVLSDSFNPPEHQTLFPAIASGGMTFDPGTTTFGVYTTSPSHTAYTEDPLNALLHPGNAEHAVRIYPLRDRDGVLIPDAFFVGFEEAANGDYQDYDFVLENVRPAPTGLLGASPLELDFGGVAVASSSTVLSVTVTNDTGADVTVDALSIGGAVPGDYAFGGAPVVPFVLADAGSVNVDVVFSPSALGSRPAVLTVSSADVATDLDVTLSGSGTAPACPNPCPADITGDCAVTLQDILALLSSWGACSPAPTPCPSDIAAGDGLTDLQDLLAMLAAWGACPTATGACCLPDTSCAVLSATDCAQQAGEYAGDLTDCLATINPCAPLQVLFVVTNAGSPTGQELARQTIMTDFGLSVTLITASSSQAAYDAATALAEVAYISEEINSGDVGTKLTDATVGIVNEEQALLDELQLAGGTLSVSRDGVRIVDASHPITAGYAIAPLTLYTSNQDVRLLNGTIAPGALVLAETNETGSTWHPSLIVVETGGALLTGTAAGRRVHLPWADGAFDINSLNTDGRLLMQRALEWAGQ